jgi:methylated-DNA-[protein]-cysteine S-methyltransferase
MKVHPRLTPSQLDKVTPFQARVLEALLQVPEGKVTTYKNISKAINCKSSQAIGQALRRNPFSPEVPCHRVVKADGTLGGYSGSFQNAPKKLKRLEDEGLLFQKNKKGQLAVDSSCIYTFKVDDEELNRYHQPVIDGKI